MNNKALRLAISVVIVLAAIGIAFYGGLRYGEMHRTSAFGPADVGATGTRPGGGAFASGRGGVVGQIVSLDNQNITISTPSGSEQTISLPAGIAISKTVPGAITDLSVGETVVVSGQTGTDGSFTASSIQIRPAQTASQ